MDNFIKNNKYFLNFAFIIALLSTLLSLYFSEVLKFAPCVLCWYQRICMYPLVIILFVALIRKTKDIIYFVLPFSIIGMIIALYHNLLYYKIIPEVISPCTLTAPCTQQQLLLYGFFTIPLGSLIAFITINLIMFLKLYQEKLISKTNSSKMKK